MLLSLKIEIDVGVEERSIFVVSFAVLYLALVIEYFSQIFYFDTSDGLGARIVVFEFGVSPLREEVRAKPSSLDSLFVGRHFISLSSILLISKLN